MVFSRRVMQYIWVIVLALIINFALPRIAPGDPAIYLVGEDITSMTEAERDQVLHEYKLDLPVYKQFANYITGIFRGDMGISLIYGRPVWDVVLHRLPWTLLIMLCSLFLSASIGVIIGVITSLKGGGKQDIGALVIVMLLGSLPPFWVAMLLIVLFSATLGWLPSFGAFALGTTPGSSDYFIGVLQRMIMPVLALTLAHVGSSYLISRSAMINALSEDYVMLCYSKGVSEMGIVIKHAFRNALLPIYTHLMLALGAIVSGATVIETVFSYPGIGNTIYESVVARDYSLLQGCFLIVTISIVLANLVTDLVYPLLDPRVRRPGGVE